MCGAGRLLERGGGARRPQTVSGTVSGTVLSLASPARDLTATSAAAAAGAGEGLACRTETARRPASDVLHHTQTTTSTDDDSTSSRKEQPARGMTLHWLSIGSEENRGKNAKNRGIQLKK